MCGICGIALSVRSARRLEATAVERMRDTLTHRGPDDCGLYLNGSVGLGHRRLSIIDVAGGQQPMLSDDGSLVIVYNGEVYNHQVLRRDLEAQGHRYRTRCDTETVLRLYEMIGTRAPTLLRGMFAFAIWNSRARELFLARDRLGVKPLYATLTADGCLYFASEIKALVAAAAVTPALYLAALPDYLANHAPSGEATLFAGVRRLLPGHTLLWKDGNVRIERYWDVSFASVGESARSERDVVNEYAERFREAVRMRLMSDVPLGMFLSGGLDSASITAMMSGLVDEPIKTFSVAFAEREANELAYARLVAERYRTDHREVVVRPHDFFAAVPKLIWHEDEPMAHPSSVALYFVSRLAAEHVKVVLTGEGSDETLAGYGRYSRTVYNVALGRRYERFAGAIFRAVISRAIQRTVGGRGLRSTLGRSFLCLPADLTSLYFENFAVFSVPQQRELLTPSTREQLGDIDPYAAQRSYLTQSQAESLLNTLLHVDIKTYLVELLMKQDQMSMAASIESRVPFLDHPLVEFTATLPERFKLRGLTGKVILRRAMQDALPSEILRRKKMGFPVPVGSWLRGAFRHVLDEYVLGERALARGLLNPVHLRRLVESHCRGDENHSERLWALINLEIWHRVFLDGEPVSDLDTGGSSAPRHSRSRAVTA
jgi:asparagine synthase (glutamine-hydrolysing)